MQVNTGSETLERGPDEIRDETEQRHRPPVSRRSVLTGVAGGVALAGCAEFDELFPRTPPGSGAQPSSDPGSPSTPAAPADPGNQPVEPVLADDDVMHLLRRATFGPTAELVAEVRDGGIDAYLDQQLAPDGIDDSACDQLLGRYPALDLSAQEINDLEHDAGGRQRADQSLIEATVLRAMASKRQFLEVMVEFWTNHFNIHTPSEDAWGRRTVSDREVYRAHALGRFADLLLASAQDPAMLRYLNNEQSCATGDPSTIQENYGRELLELHTLGVGNYTEEDVKNSAYILTGWRVDDARQFRFDAGCHYTGEVTVLDFTHPNESAEGGLEVGEQYIDYLAHHELTANFICRKLVRRFVADNPDDALVDALAATYLENDTEIAPVLRALFASDEFLGSVGQKTRRPLEDILASARALGLSVRESPGNDRPRTLLDVAYDMGHAPMNWGTPDGYPDVAGAWLSSARLLGSWNYHWDLIEGRYDDWLSTATAAVMQLDGGEAATVGDLVDALTERLLWQRMRDQDRAAVIEFTGSAAADPTGDGDEQTDLRKRVVLAILNSPYHLQR